MRTIRCRMCGKEMEREKSGTLCPDCRLKAKRDSLLRPRVCKTCGKDFVGFPRSMFCPDCNAVRKKERAKRDRQRAKAGKTRRLGSVEQCENCGADYIVNSALQRYCKACAAVVVRENTNARAREYARSHMEEYTQRKKDVRENLAVCVVCGKSFTARTATTCCSPECESERKFRWQAQCDMKRGKRKTLERAERKKPQSGVVGVTYHQGKWQAIYKKKYIGVFDTVEEAKKAIDAEMLRREESK